jgi:hypothetical protein
MQFCQCECESALKKAHSPMHNIGYEHSDT